MILAGQISLPTEILSHEECQMVIPVNVSLSQDLVVRELCLSFGIKNACMQRQNSVGVKPAVVAAYVLYGCDRERMVEAVGSASLQVFDLCAFYKKISTEVSITKHSWDEKFPWFVFDHQYFKEQ